MTDSAVEVRSVDDRADWNELVQALPHSTLRHGWEWGALRSQQGWEVRRLAVFLDGRGVAAVSILLRRVPLLGWSFLYAPGGALVSDPEESRAWNALLNAVNNVAAAERAVVLRVDPQVPDDHPIVRSSLLENGFRHLPDDWTDWNLPRIVMQLDVSAPEAELRRKLQKRVSQYLGRLVKGGGTIEQETSAAGVQRFHQMLAKMGQRKGLPVRSVDFFEKLHRQYLVNGDGCLLIARAGGQDLGGLLAARFGRHVYLLYSCLDPESEGGRRLHPGPNLYWALIAWAKAQGCTMIDWGGSGTNYPARESDPGFGVYRFKQAFGSSLVYLSGYYDRVYKPIAYRMFRVAERRFVPCAWYLHSKFSGPLREWRRRWHVGTNAAMSSSEQNDARGVTSATSTRRLRILFLGNSHHPLSIACLDALARTHHHVTVGSYSSFAGGVWATVREVMRSRGTLFVVRKALSRAIADARALLRRVGLSPTRFGSRDEILRAYQMPTIPCHEPNSPKFVQEVMDLGIDLIVVAGFSRILKKDIIGSPQLGTINVHPSLLPKYRGPDPYYWVLAHGERETGVTIHYIDAGIDTGNIILQEPLPIAPDETQATLHMKAAALAAQLLPHAVDLLADGTAPSIPQDHSQATYFSFAPKAGAATQ